MILSRARSSTLEGLGWLDGILVSERQRDEHRMITESHLDKCPCGSDIAYSNCCQQWHSGAAAPDPEALMRSRYAAFVLKDKRYLLDTWHSSTRPRELDFENSPSWASLSVISSADEGSLGSVHFRAIYHAGSGWGCLEEISQFVKENGRWFYREGESSEGVLKPGRNEPCPCGSGRKFKACCL